MNTFELLLCSTKRQRSRQRRCCSELMSCLLPSAGYWCLLTTAFIYLIKIGDTRRQEGQALNPFTLHHPLPAGAGPWAELRATKTQGMHLPLPRNRPRPLVSYYESEENFTSPWKKGLNQWAAPSFSNTSCTGKRRIRTEAITHQSPSVGRQPVMGAEQPVHQSGSRHDAEVSVFE